MVAIDVPPWSISSASQISIIHYVILVAMRYQITINPRIGLREPLQDILSKVGDDVKAWFPADFLAGFPNPLIKFGFICMDHMNTLHNGFHFISHQHSMKFH